MKPLRCILIDIDGVLYTGSSAIPGSIDAVAWLRRRAVPMRFVTNATRRTRRDIVAQLRSMGFELEEHEVTTGALAARRLLEARGLRPHLLVHPGLLPDFAGLDSADPNAVVIGDAADGFSYAALNRAFRVLMDRPGAPLIAIANNRYFRAAEGLALDAGPFVAALEYAAGVRAELTGKPAPAIFHAALEELGCAPDQAVMIGDDLDSDVGGAQRAGCRAVLVRTGKFRAADELHPTLHADAVADDLHHAVTEFIAPRLAE